MGILSISIGTTLLFLILPEEFKPAFLPIVKLVVGLWMIRFVLLLFGHSIL